MDTRWIEIEVPLHLVPVGALFGATDLICVVLMEPALSKVVASRIEEAILASGFASQAEFAAHTGLSRTTLSRILTSEVDLRLSTLEQIAKSLGLPAYLLLYPEQFGEQSKPSPEMNLRAKGPRAKAPAIAVKISVPPGVEPRDWLVAAVTGGAFELPVSGHPK